MAEVVRVLVMSKRRPELGGDAISYFEIPVGGSSLKRLLPALRRCAHEFGITRWCVFDVSIAQGARHALEYVGDDSFAAELLAAAGGSFQLALAMFCPRLLSPTSTGGDGLLTDWQRGTTGQQGRPPCDSAE